MEKREVSSTLRNLKFMQRAAPKGEKIKEEEKRQEPDGRFVSTVSSTSGATTARRRCLVIVEGDPHPGAFKGRMSFQSFNPSIDKLNEETSTIHQMPMPLSSNENGSISDRSEESQGTSSENNLDADLKRKQSAVEMDTKFSNKLPRVENREANGKLKLHSQGSSIKQQKREKLDWNLLRPPKAWQK
ncbi:hypothetical protein HPP92_006364 [Vanilla planifolia]|uniref:M-phase phosphoprotein 6 n=2 Tax=Vanilla planifolia TaxID=51239 RepID=A0A835RBW7_VANPL|nr:hypothetical protein HPP92_006364 [Vanilla planifolia]